MENEEDVVAEYPVLSGVLVLAVAAVAWVAVSLALGGDVDPLTTALFAVTFTAVYLLFHRYA